MAFGMHFKIWSDFKKQNVTSGGHFITNALSAAVGMVKSHMNRLSTMAGYFVCPPPAMMPPSTGHS